MEISQVQGLIEALGATEEPFGIYYTDTKPEGGLSPKQRQLPAAEEEARGEVDFGEVFAAFSCVMGYVWRARRQKTAAYFDRERQGCLGGAFYLGYLKPQLNVIAHYVSSGIPGVMEGERFMASPDDIRRFFQTIDPRPAPSRFCVFKPLSQFSAGETPEVVAFFGRPEMISGLHTLAAFVTGDPEVVAAPFGADCSFVLTWPLHYLSQGKLRAVLGGWDPSARRYHRPDELSFTMPWELFQAMVGRWPEPSSLPTPGPGSKRKSPTAARSGERNSQGKE